MNDDFQSKSMKGFIVVAVFLMVVGASGRVEDLLNIPKAAGESFHPKVSFEAVFSEETKEDQRRFLPVDFESEVLSLESFSEIHISENGAVIGFFSPKNLSETKMLCSDLLKERGWVEMTSGQEGISSYVKEGGGYSWALLSCSSMGKGTAVVLQVESR